ncbi:SHOCT domain-containing protein [Oceaniglobus indicus]|uniref:SHOCT domain-containing protein n=1 Tax=Oceaniglobus indicus TaxID=2047749 RepID=UPI000C1A6C89|nr:SHOCT domain-containing protein [Oceaniglobus indicus]
MALLKEIETLTRLHRNGTLSDAEYTAAKRAILNEVPDAQTEDPAVTAMIHTMTALAACLLPPIILGLAVFALGIPAMLSLTLAVTVLAAIVIAQYHRRDGH